MKFSYEEINVEKTGKKTEWMRHTDVPTVELGVEQRCKERKEGRDIEICRSC